MGFLCVSFFSVGAQILNHDQLDLHGHLHRGDVRQSVSKGFLHRQTCLPTQRLERDGRLPRGHILGGRPHYVSVKQQSRNLWDSPRVQASENTATAQV